MKTRKYTYTCEHPGSDVVITSDKPVDNLRCPLCAAAMVSLYDKLLGVPYNKDTCPDCGVLLLNAGSAIIEGKLLKRRFCIKGCYRDWQPVHLKDIDDLPVRDIDMESAEEGKDILEHITGEIKMRVPEKVVITETPYSDDNKRRGSWKEPLDG